MGAVDPLSLSMVTAFLGAAGAGMANEAGKRAWETVGGLVARVVGREVPAPVGPAERESVAGLLVAEALRNPEQARALAAVMSGGGTGGAAAHGVPRLLPASARFFTDRKGPLALLDREADRKPDGLPKVAVLHGPAGIGTSALAFHWGGREAGRFPDGTLYMDLRGGSASTAPTAATVLRHFLLRLGVPAEYVPPAVEDRVDLFRSLLSGRRLLVVLDHAQSAGQVGPLITAAPGVFTLIVARRPLTGLDAVTVSVGPLSDKDARRLLAELAGRSALVTARAALPSVLERCAGSPFALRAMAPYLATGPLGGGDPGGPLAASGPVTAADPRSEGGPVPPVRAVAEEVYRRLGAEAARVYRLGSLRPWPSLNAAVVAVTAEVPEDEAQRALAELAELQLLESTGDGRYRYRPAVRAHAEETAAREDGLAGCAAAVARAADWYLRFAVRADYAALKERWHLGPLFAELGPGPYEDEGAAVAALVAEAGNLVESVLAAEEFGRFDTVCQTVEALWAVQLKAGSHDVLLPALRAGARTAGRHCPGTRTAGRMHIQLAFALMELRQDDEAERELLTAAEDEARAGHARGRATAVESLGLLRLRQWRFRPALECFEEADGLLDRIGPADDGAADVPRARALLHRHRGRALRGLGRFDEAAQRLATAREFFRDSGERYNTARVLTDLAELHLDAADHAGALPLIDEAVLLLSRENATVHLTYLAGLRAQCLPDRP
ncbi:tetratricopeptide repeat protein [Kitasatospora purpeofusca]|uniref:tetratricopeptide repeat protein n=1 Tax=Kitasatospora purpeofusca TaxID=67352 RepID=UPI002A59CFE0|nr:tetratricopeptide repeat protein [Kitasatospora purpeofusca]MDY0815762.1 tetratricopeptide repeat protein [Kitasatospora purpeofusca]